jgi:hypothetical protein
VAMKLYLTAMVITVAATVIIINACMFHPTSSHAVPINVYQLQ